MYHPTGRVLTVLEILQFKPGITGPEPAERLSVDVRTVGRYIEKLRDVGIPVEASPGRYGGYRLRPGYKLPLLVFSDEEATAMVLGLLGSRWLELDQSPATVAAAISKITRVLPESARERLSALSSLIILQNPGNEQHLPGEMLIDLSQAIEAGQILSMTYTAQDEQTTQRVVEPCGLVGRRGYWYLVAFCRLRSDFRSFRLDRIEELSVDSATFERSPSFDCRTYAERALSSYVGGIHYTVHFYAAAEVVRRAVGGLASGVSRTDGGVSFTATTDSFEYEARFPANFGIPFRVVEPAEPADALREPARRVELSARQNTGGRRPSAGRCVRSRCAEGCELTWSAVQCRRRHGIQDGRVGRAEAPPRGVLESSTYRLRRLLPATP